MTEPIEAPPRASVLVESMRDIGYQFETALADIIDNSITAGASEVHIHVDSDKNHPRLAIVDNGAGMTREALIASMRLGSTHPREVRQSKDLGRFGLGLKTASFSQCRKLTVVTRSAGETSVATWDLDLIAATDKWSLLVPDTAEGIPFVQHLGPQGALVLWEKLDRAMEADGSDAARQHFIRHVDAASRHLELVFHRYLEGDSRTRRVSILVNSLPLKPYDPFHTAHAATIHGPTDRLKIRDHVVEIQPFTLPHHRNVTAVEWERYGGSEGYLKNQGFYLYREKRLLLSGTWFGLARQAELTKLTRVRVDIPNALDEDWHVDVKKASARPPRVVREKLQELIREIGAPSTKIYTKRAVRLYGTGNEAMWERAQRDSKTVYRLNEKSGPIQAFAGRLSRELTSDFARLTKAIAAALPLDAIFADLAGSPETIAGEPLDESDLRGLLLQTIGPLQATGISARQLNEILRHVEPFRSHWEQTELLLTDIL